MVRTVADPALPDCDPVKVLKTMCPHSGGGDDSYNGRATVLV